MQYKICRDTYHMFYIIGTEDAFVRKHGHPLNTRKTNRHRWLDERWCQGLTMEEKQNAESEAAAIFK